MIIDNGSNPPIGFEKLFVDSDQALAARTTLIQVPELGLVNARLAAIRAAKSDLLAFVDDDNLCTLSYRQEIFKWATNPQFGYLGVTLSLPGSRQENNLDEDLLSTFAIGKAAGASGKLPKGHTVWGAGMVVNRNAALVLLECGYKPILTGRQGTKQIAGDDSELCIMLSSVGLEGYFSSIGEMLHDVAESRFSTKNYQKTRMGFALASATLTALRRMANRRVKAGSSILAIARAMVSTVKLSIRSLIESPRPRHLNPVFYIDGNFKIALAIAYIQGIWLLYKNRAIVHQNGLAMTRAKLFYKNQFSRSSRKAIENGCTK